MPVLAVVNGIKVTINFCDHSPPHFHAEYNGRRALVEIKSARVVEGSLPPKQAKLIIGFCVLHEDELLRNWDLAKKGEKLVPIEGFENV